MIELDWSELKDSLASPVALTVGVFDGIHTGHRELISRITALDDMVSVVVTFRRLPTEILPGRRYVKAATAAM